MDMDEEGVDVQIIYPTVGGQMQGREFHDTELLAACCRAYNDWSADYCSAAPQRLRWAAMLPMQDVDKAIEEARSRREKRRRQHFTCGPIRSRAATCIIATTGRC